MFIGHFPRPAETDPYVFSFSTGMQHFLYWSIFSGLATRALYFKKKDVKRTFFPSCRNWPICLLFSPFLPFPFPSPPLQIANTCESQMLNGPWRGQIWNAENIPSKKPLGIFCVVFYMNFLTGMYGDWWFKKGIFNGISDNKIHHMAFTKHT